MSYKIPMIAAVLLVAISSVYCGGSQPAPNGASDAGKTSSDAGSNADAGAVVDTDAGPTSDASTEPPPPCGTPATTLSNTLAVKYTAIGKAQQTIAFAAPTLTVDWFPADPNSAAATYFDLTSDDGNYLLEVSLYEFGQQFVCPISQSLSASGLSDPYTVDLYDNADPANPVLLSSSWQDGPGTGTLKIDSFVATPGAEEITFSCAPNCTLVTAPPNGGANVNTCVVTGGIHIKI